MGRHEEALKILHGGTVIPAIPLVLDENRKFNEAGQRTLIRYYLDAGVGGLAVAVHTTQFEIRKPEVGLFEPVLRVTKEEMDAYEARTGKTLVRVAGACGEAEQACAETRTAKALGFDAVLLSPGGLAHRTEEELVERTHAVAAEMPVIGFYLQTACGGRRLSYEYWKAVADTPGVVAIKCASFNRYQSIDLVRGVQRAAGGNCAVHGQRRQHRGGPFDAVPVPGGRQRGGAAVRGGPAGALVGVDAQRCEAVRRAAGIPGRPRHPGGASGAGRGGHRLQRRVLRRGAQLCRMHPGGP